MSMTELERHLLDGLEKLQHEFKTTQKAQEAKINQLNTALSNQAKSIQQLGEFYKDLEPLLQRLNTILDKVS